MSDPRLIVLAGGPARGAGELATRYADEHPGVLAVDPATIASWIGGGPRAWSGHVRTLALTLVEAHLRAGFDAVLACPALVGEARSELETSVARTGAELVEVRLHGLVDVAGDGTAEDPGPPGERPGHRLAVHADPDVTLRALVDLVDPDLPA